MAVVDYFLKIDGIEGTSISQQHKGEIEIESFSWGASRTPGSASGGGGRGGGDGRVQMQDFHFVMKTNKSSPKLFLACATGEHFTKGILALRKPGNEAVDFLKVALTDVVVTSFQVGGGDEMPLEQISLSFTKIEWEYTSVTPSGHPDKKIKAGYNLKTNSPL